MQNSFPWFFFLPSFFLPANGFWLAGKKRAGK
jgi:hypothetical protein